RHTRSYGDWSSDVCSSDLKHPGEGDSVAPPEGDGEGHHGRSGAGVEHAAAQRSPRCGSDVSGVHLIAPAATATTAATGLVFRRRSEERRVGKEWRARGAGG